MEKLPQLRQGELPARTNKNMHTHINTAIYTYVCGHCKCFLPRFLSRFSQFSCTGRDGWWKGGGGRFESDFPRDCRERCRGGGARTVEGSSAFCFCYELRMLSCAARPHRTTKVRLRRGHTYRHIHICLWALQMFFGHVLWADSVSFLARDGMVGEKAEADALRATSPEIAENVEEEVVPELLRAVPLSVFATNLECCHALPGPTGQQKWGWGGDIHTAIYTYVCGHCKCFLAMFCEQIRSVFLHGTGWLVKRRRRTLWERLPPRLQRTLKRRWCQNCWGQFRFLFLLRT